ncbi:hypothetical protein BKA69DRAFT_1176612 [Paraphysoderma sedebokerense]|nr:hypothetical protein BKA69DRAFT_1176612 [Paraphysoderma sedebokerense]
MVCLMAVMVSAAESSIEEATDDPAVAEIEIIDPADHDCKFVKPSSMEAKSQEIEGKNDRRSPRRGLFSCLLPKADDKKKKVNVIHADLFAVEHNNPLTYACYILMDASVLRNQRKTYIPKIFDYPNWGVRKMLHTDESNTREYEAKLFEESNLDDSETTGSTEPIRFGNTTHKIAGVTFSTIQVSWPKHVLKHMKASCQHYGFYESDEVVKYADLLAKSADPNAEVDPLWGRILGAENFYNKELH